MRLSLVLPCFNEEPNLEATLRDVLAWFDSTRIEGEVIVVDDGSTDDSPRIVQRLALGDRRVRLVSHDRNRGYGAAVRSGCDAAGEEWIGFMDSDGQFRAADFSRLLPHCRQFELVVGRRIRRADPWHRRAFMMLYSWLVRMVLGVRVQDVNCAMKLFRASLWPALRPRYAEGALLNAEMFHRAALRGIAWRQVGVRHYPRRYGRQTGGSPAVVLRMFRDLYRLKRASSGPGQGQGAADNGD